MEQVYIPSDIWGLILLENPSPLHKLICKSAYQFLKTNHPLRLWFNKVLNEIHKEPFILDVYSEMELPKPYILYNIHDDENPVQVLLKIRLRALYYKEGMSPFDRGEKDSCTPYGGVGFYMSIKPGLVVRVGAPRIYGTPSYRKEVIKILKSNSTSLIGLFKD